MYSEVGDGTPARLPATVNGTRPSEPENLPCPRCDSTNTKFCYYNNYNLSQPRHFCKSCRRYWTRGGTLRNIPVGGGTRKHSSHKRPRTASGSSPAPTTPVHEPVHANPISMVPEVCPGSRQPGSGSVSLMGCEVNLNESVPEVGSSAGGTFTSLLTSPVGVGFVPLGGFGLGLGGGLHGMGFGLGRADWPMESIDVGGGINGGEVGGNVDDGGEATWQLSSGGIEGDGDCFGWPELAISAPGTSLK